MTDGIVTITDDIVTMTDDIVTVSIQFSYDELRLTPIAYVVLRFCTICYASGAISPRHRYEYELFQYFLYRIIQG